MGDVLKESHGQKYLVLFVVVMFLNTFLVIILLRSSHGQTRNADFSSQKPVNIEVLQQKNCPLKITIANVDNYSDMTTFQKVTYRAENITDKPIRAYVLRGLGKHNPQLGRIVTNSWAAEWFQPHQEKSEDFFIERESIDKEANFLLSIDYIDFSDGSSWGADEQGMSRVIKATRKGRNAAIKQFKDSLSNNDGKWISDRLTKVVEEISIEIPETNQPEEWKKSFRSGYKSILYVLQSFKNRPSNEDLLNKLEELEKINSVKEK